MVAAPNEQAPCASSATSSAYTGAGVSPVGRQIRIPGAAPSRAPSLAATVAAQDAAGRIRRCG